MSESMSNLIPNMTAIINTIYPVGSYFWSDQAASPADLWKVGTWERIKDKFVLAAGDSYTVGSSGGETAHTLTVDEMPKHRHEHIYGIADSQQIYFVDSNGMNMGGAAVVTNTDNTSAQYRSIATTGDAGSGQPHNNMPPYITAYCWHRTA